MNAALHLTVRVTGWEVFRHIPMVEKKLLPLVGLFLGQKAVEKLTGQGFAAAHLLQSKGLAGIHFFF